jgi:parvulin-like peptidyl-prolyl isomerase
VTRPSLRPWVLLALVLVTLTACAGSGGDLAASIGDAEITHEQVEADMVAFAFLSELNGATCGTPVAGESQDAACARLVLSNQIQEEIVKAYAVDNGVAVDRADVEEAVAQLEESIGGAEVLDERLTAAGMTREGFLAFADRLLLFGEVQQAVVEERLDEEALRALYEENVPQFTTVEVSHILLESEEEAEEVAAEATPENFARLARQRSIDPGSAPAGGSLGAFSEAEFRQRFDPTFVEAALALEPGGISGVVPTQFGYHVIHLVRRDVAPFEDVREQLAAQQAGQVFDTWLGERYDETAIEVNPRYGRLDPATRQVVAIRSTADDPAATGATGGTGATGPTAAT